MNAISILFLVLSQVPEGAGMITEQNIGEYDLNAEKIYGDKSADADTYIQRTGANEWSLVSGGSSAVFDASGIHLSDNLALKLGNTPGAPDGWIDSNGTSVCLTSTDIDGGGTDGDLFCFTLGSNLLTMGGGLDLNGRMLYVDEDADTYIDDGTVDDRIRFAVGGTERMRLTSSLTFYNVTPINLNGSYLFDTSGPVVIQDELKVTGISEDGADRCVCTKGDGSLGTCVCGSCTCG